MRFAAEGSWGKLLERRSRSVGTLPWPCPRLSLHRAKCNTNPRSPRPPRCLFGQKLPAKTLVPLQKSSEGCRSAPCVPLTSVTKKNCHLGIGRWLFTAQLGGCTRKQSLTDARSLAGPTSPAASPWPQSLCWWIFCKMQRHQGATWAANLAKAAA